MSSFNDLISLLENTKNISEINSFFPVKPVDVNYAVTVEPTEKLTQYFDEVKAFYKIIEINNRNVFTMFGYAGSRKTTSVEPTVFFRVELDKPVFVYYTATTGGTNWANIEARYYLEVDGNQIIQSNTICSSFQKLAYYVNETFEPNGAGGTVSCSGIIIANAFDFIYYTAYPYCTGSHGIRFGLTIVPLAEYEQP